MTNCERDEGGTGRVVNQQRKAGPTPCKTHREHHLLLPQNWVNLSREALGGFEFPPAASEKAVYSDLAAAAEGGVVLRSLHPLPPMRLFLTVSASITVTA